MALTAVTALSRAAGFAVTLSATDASPTGEPAGHQVPKSIARHQP
jgi:hypothetical protein